MKPTNKCVSVVDWLGQWKKLVVYDAVGEGLVVHLVCCAIVANCSILL